MPRTSRKGYTYRFILSHWPGSSDKRPIAVHSFGRIRHYMRPDFKKTRPGRPSFCTESSNVDITQKPSLKSCHFVAVKFEEIKVQIPQRQVLYCPAVFGHFLDPPGNHPRGAIFPKGELNQSIKRRLPLQTFHLIDWLIEDKLTLTWLVDWIRTARSVFTGAGLKWLKTAGQYSNLMVKKWLPTWVM